MHERSHARCSDSPCNASIRNIRFHVLSNPQGTSSRNRAYNCNIACDCSHRSSLCRYDILDTAKRFYDASTVCCCALETILQVIRDTYIFGMSTNVIRRLRIIRAFRQPFFNCTAIGRCMVIHTTSEAGITSVSHSCDMKHSVYVTHIRDCVPEYGFT